MIYNIYSLKDELVGFGAPLIHENDAAAKRALYNAFIAANSVFAASPKDYNLYVIGAFDTATGFITGESTPQLVCGCSDFRKE